MSVAKNRCPTVEEISAYIDGDARVKRATWMRLHIAHCHHCREVEVDLVFIQKGLATIGKETRVPISWEGIRRREEKSLGSFRPVKRWWLRFAPIPIAAAISFFILWGHRTEPASDNAEPETQSDQALLEVQRAEGIYREAIAALETAVLEKNMDFESRTLVVVKESLNEIDSALERCRAAIAEEPKNLDARKALLAAYQQKVDLLTDLVFQRI